MTRLCPNDLALPQRPGFAPMTRLCLNYQAFPQLSGFALIIRFCPNYQVLPYLSGLAPIVRLCPNYQGFPLLSRLFPVVGPIQALGWSKFCFRLRYRAYRGHSLLYRVFPIRPYSTLIPIDSRNIKAKEHVLISN